MKEVSVVIPNYNGIGYIRALPGQPHDPDCLRF